MKKSNLLRYGLLAGACAVMAACSETYEEPIQEKTETEKESEKEAVIEPASEDDVIFTPIDLTWPERRLIWDQSPLAWELLQATLNENKGEDVIVSPLCAEIALAMTANGMDAESAAKALKVLKASDLNALNSVYNRIITLLPNCNPPGVNAKMCFANWQDSNVKFKPDYTKTLEEVFGVPTYTVDFRATDMNSVVNKWVSENTGGLIPDMLSKPMDTAVGMILCNTLYLDSKWEFPFDETKTKAEDFKDFNGNKVGQAMMMRYKSPVAIEYEQYDNYKVARLDYKGSEFHMYIYVPMDNCKSYDELIAAIQYRNSDGFTGNYGFYLTPEMVLPRFEFSGNYEMNEILKSLGIDLHSCNYSGISDQLEKVDMKQGSSIKVEETGTLVTSATIQEFYVSWGGKDPEIGEPFIVDRPFIYTIESREGIVMYIGTMSNPGVK